MIPKPEPPFILHLGPDPTESALLSAELAAESLPARVTHASTESELRAVLAANHVSVVVADLPLPWAEATRQLADLQRARPELSVVFRSGSTGSRTVAEPIPQTARAVREALEHPGGLPASQSELVERFVSSQETLLRLGRRDLWEFDDVIADIVRSASELLDVKRVSLWELDPESSKLVCDLVYDRERGLHRADGELELGPQYVAALEAATFVAADDAQHDPRTSELTPDYLGKHGITSMLDAPVRQEGHIVGVLCHEHIGPVRRWTLLEQCNAAALADIVARAFEVRARRRLERRLRESEKFEVIGRLAGRLAHDFNNLLTVILGNAQLGLQRHPTESVEREGLEQIIGASEVASDLIRQLLAYSRREVIKPEIVDIHGLMKSLLPMLERLVGLDVHVTCDLGMGPMYVLIDPTQFQQVVLNLAANAREAMPAGGALTITMANEPANAAALRQGKGMRVRLSVVDTGRGIAPEILPHIFDSFFTTKDKNVGAGLGLASVAEIVRRAGGDVLVKSHVGRGSTFEILLPSQATSMLAIEPPGGAAQSEPTVRKPGSLTIILVEPDVKLRRAWTSDLTGGGFGVLEANGVVEALEWLARGSHVDAVVSGFQLQRMDGVALIRHLRDFMPQLPALLIADAARRGQIDLAALRETGPTELIAGPPAPRVLVEALGRLHARV